MKAWRIPAMIVAALLAAAPALAQAPAAPATAPPRTLTTGPAAAPAPAATPAAAPVASPGGVETAAAPARSGAETVRLSADTSQGFARISFLWPSPVTFDASLADGVLIVKFARPFKLPAGQGRIALDAYVSVIKLDPDGRTMRLSLTQKVRLHTSAAGPLVGIDLLPPGYKGEPADVVDPTVKPPPPKIVTAKLKIAVEKDLTRLSFDWGMPVDYEATVKDGKIAVVFKQGGSIDVSRLQKNPPAFVKGASASGGDDKVLLDITVDPDSPVTHKRDKGVISFEIGAPKNDKDADPEIVVPEEIVADAEAGKEKDKAGEPPAKDGEGAAGEKSGDGEDAHEAKPAPGGEGEGHREPELRPGSDGAAVAAAEEEPEHEAAAPEDEHDPAGEDHPGETPEHGEQHGDEAAPAPPPAEPPPFKTVRSKAQIVLTLPAVETTPAAMFRRGETVFIVLAASGAIDAAAILKQNKDLVASAEANAVGGATVLKLAMTKPMAVTAGLSGGAWTATLSPDPLDAPHAVALLRDARTVGPARVRATLERAGKPLEIADPSSGERLIVVPASGAPQGVIGSRAYVDFAAEVTAQGLLLRPFVDDLSVAPGEHDVVIGSPSGLTLSAGAVTEASTGGASLAPAEPARMDFETWAGKGSFLDERSRLVNAIDAKGDNVAETRLALARFYLARDLGAEALGELQLLVSDDETITGDLNFRALRATALLLLGRPKQAMDDLSAGSLEGDANALLLRGLAAAGLEAWGAARDNIVAGEGAIAGFRPDWQARFRLAGARAGLETNAIDITDRMLGALPKGGLPRPLAIEADLIRGELAARLKHEHEALDQFAKVRESGYRPLAVRAALAEIVLKESLGTLKPAEAIKALDDLRWQWRGDGLELAVLHRLATLQIASGDYRNGLQTMRAAVLGFPDAEEARHIGAEMQGVFEDLFLHGKADSMPPIQALGLYYDFKELTPIGTLGDEMVRRLADRLIAVDLLEQAAELLQHQVDRRLDGVAKAQIAAKLAAVYLMDKKPEKALAALRASSQTRLPDDLAGQRRLLTGRALSDLKQYDAALEAFEQDDTPEAHRLRADVLWAATRWAETAAAVEILIAGREKNPAPLDAVDRYDILRTAVAYTMADDDKGLASLRDRFVALMAAAPEAAAFELITRAVDPSGVAFRDVAKSIAATDTLDAFLQSLGLGRPAEGSAAR